MLVKQQTPDQSPHNPDDILRRMLNTPPKPKQKTPPKPEPKRG